MRGCPLGGGGHVGPTGRHGEELIGGGGVCRQEHGPGRLAGRMAGRQGPEGAASRAAQHKEPHQQHHCREEDSREA